MLLCCVFSSSHSCTKPVLASHQLSFNFTAFKQASGSRMGVLEVTEAMQVEMARFMCLCTA